MSESERILVEPWTSVPRQREGATLGMWVFLGSEVMFFGSLFLVYAVYRTLYPQAFLIGSKHAPILYGSINTGLLITSSFVMLVAVQASRYKMRRLLLASLLLVFLFGLAYLAVLSREWVEDIHQHLVPYTGFTLQPQAARLFFGLYWVMTGLHAIHTALGCLLVLGMTAAIALDRVVVDTPKMSPVSLYWQFVTALWIMLYTVLYLPGRP